MASSLPATMKVVQMTRTGDVDVLEYNDVPLPTLAEGQVLVRNRFSGVNFIDTYFRTGLYAVSFPFTFGREGAGEVAAAHPSVPAGFGLSVGAKVAYMSNGSYAEYTAVAADRVTLIPEGLGQDVAAASLLQGLTALTMIREGANVQAGEWVLVHAAAGGVGSLLVQMLKAVGAKVIATASTEEKCALARRLGAEYTVNSHSDVAAKVKEITAGHGIDAIFDGVGAATFDADLEMIASKGRLLSFGNASGAVPPLSILKLGPKNVKLMRPVVNGFVAEAEDLQKYTKELFELIVSKKVEINIFKVYALNDTGSAHTDLTGRKTTGKLLIKCD